MSDEKQQERSEATLHPFERQVNPEECYRGCPECDGSDTCPCRFCHSETGHSSKEQARLEALNAG